jgi:hypothetical protein
MPRRTKTQASETGAERNPPKRSRDAAYLLVRAVQPGVMPYVRSNGRVRWLWSAATDAAAKTVVLAGMIVVIMVAWLIAGASLAPMLRDPRRARIVNVVLAAALVGASMIAILH